LSCWERTRHSRTNILLQVASDLRTRKLSLHSFAIRTWADLPAGIVAAEQAGSPGLAHLLRALQSGRIAFLPLRPVSSYSYFKTFAGQTKSPPAVIWIGGDNYQDCGPGSWPAAQRGWGRRSESSSRLRAWKTGPTNLPFEQRKQFRRLAFIECSTSTAAGWADLIGAAGKRRSTLLIWPKEGVHPILPPHGFRQ
jgi:hypothetical protein